jgi:hypothetical protein
MLPPPPHNTCLVQSSKHKAVISPSVDTSCFLQPKLIHVVEENCLHQDLRLASGCIFNFRVSTDLLPKTYSCDKFYYFEHETMNEIHDLNACKFSNLLSVTLIHDSYRKTRGDMLPLLKFKESVLRNIKYVTEIDNIIVYPYIAFFLKAWSLASRLSTNCYETSEKQFWSMWLMRNYCIPHFDLSFL